MGRLFGKKREGRTYALHEKDGIVQRDGAEILTELVLELRRSTCDGSVSC